MWIKNVCNKNIHENNTRYTRPPHRNNQPQQMFISERHLCGVCVVISENIKKNHDMWETDERLYPHTAVRKENNARKLSEEEEEN